MIANGGFSGWSSSRYELGWCKLYNSAWGNGQCIEVDSDLNVRYTQVIYICSETYSSLVMQMLSYERQCQINGISQLSINNANTQIALTGTKINGLIKNSINIMKCKFDDYLQDLYGNVCQEVQDIKEDQSLELSKFDCLSAEWKKHFGYSYEPDFTCSHSDYDLKYGFCIIISITGKVITCKSDAGLHQLQIAPCTHFEGTYTKPRCGDSLFWKGTHGSNGKIHVTVATSCNCK